MEPSEFCLRLQALVGPKVILCGHNVQPSFLLIGLAHEKVVENSGDYKKEPTDLEFLYRKSFSVDDPDVLTPNKTLNDARKVRKLV